VASVKAMESAWE
jgi:hypothetical protein